jgi:hypothetical protein
MGGLLVVPVRMIQRFVVGPEIDNAIRKSRERNMKKITGVLAGCVILALVIFLLLNDSRDKDNSTLKAVPLNATSGSEASAGQQEIKDNKPSGPEVTSDSSVTQDEFKQLPQEQQDEMMEEFIIDFWEKELGLQDTSLEDKRLSLDIFNRPYMKTITESEYFQLSPEDQEKAMAEVVDTARKTRSFVMDVIAQGKFYVANNDYVRAEAYYIYAWEVGREFTTNKEGMYITRLVGISCEKNALNELVKVYDHFGEHSKVQKARGRLTDLEKEVEEMKRTAR